MDEIISQSQAMFWVEKIADEHELNNDIIKILSNKMDILYFKELKRKIVGEMGNHIEKTLDYHRIRMSGRAVFSEEWGILPLRYGFKQPLNIYMRKSSWPGRPLALFHHYSDNIYYINGNRIRSIPIPDSELEYYRGQYGFDHVSLQHYTQKRETVSPISNAQLLALQNRQRETASYEKRHRLSYNVINNRKKNELISLQRIVRSEMDNEN